MSLTPEPVSGLPTAPPPPGQTRSTRTPRLLRLSFALFTFEIGLFLAIFPWVDVWSLNHLSEWIPALDRVWEDPSFKGAITGLGLVNIYLAFAEVLRLFKRTS